MEDAERIADWNTLMNHLPADYEALAIEHKQLNTQWANAKIGDAQTLLRFIFAHAGADLPLRQTVAAVAEAGGPDLSANRLHFRMRRAYPYLSALVQRMQDDRPAVTPDRWCGYELTCIDATALSGPGAEGTDARVHTVLRIADLQVQQVKVTGVEDGETLRRFSWPSDQLVIGDRGYSHARGIAAVVAAGSDALIRLNPNAMPLRRADDRSEIDVPAFCRELIGHRVGELRATSEWRDGRDRHEVVGRLIGIRLGEEETAAARDRLRREHGASVSGEQLELAAYVVLFTTATTARLPAARAVEAYRLRWQIELQFKRWKSLCNFDKLPNYRDDTIKSWLTAKVLLAMVMDRIGAQKVRTDPNSSRPDRAMARNPWKLTNLAWAAILTCIVPLGLLQFVEHTPSLVERLESLDSGLPHRQVTHFRNRFPTDAERSV